MASFAYQTVASAANSGSLVESLGAGAIATLSYDYLFNYTQFLQTAQSDVNQQVQAVEAGEAEGTRNYLVIENWPNGSANAAASQINSAWSSGKLTGTDGKPLQAWPDAGYNQQIAWSVDNGSTLELRWVKWEWQLYLVVFVLVALLGYAVYVILTQSNWNLATATPTSSAATGTSTKALFNGTPFLGGSPFRIFWLPWYWDVGIAATVVAGPYVYHQIASIDESHSEIIRAKEEE